MSRDIPPRPPEGAGLLVYPAPVRLTLGLDRPWTSALRRGGTIRQSQRFHVGDRDDAIGFPKPASVAVAKLATMVLSETRGL
jgi:hypothetical protein